MSDFHVHLPENFAGTIHIHQADDVLTVTRDGSPSIPEVMLAGDADEAPPDSSEEASGPPYPPEIDAILKRQESHDGTSRSREIVELLTKDGWEAKAPKNRNGAGPSPVGYVRLVYAGAAKKSALYVNSARLVSNGTADREFASPLPGADVRSSDVYFTHSPTEELRDQALAAARALRVRADGQLS